MCAGRLGEVLSRRRVFPVSFTKRMLEETRRSNGSRAVSPRCLVKDKLKSYSHTSWKEKNIVLEDILGERSRDCEAALTSLCPTSLHLTVPKLLTKYKAGTIIEKKAMTKTKKNAKLLESGGCAVNKHLTGNRMMISTSVQLPVL